MSTFINADKFVENLAASMNAEMVAAAEPIIKRAVEEAEREMRRKIGQMCISLIEHSFAVERFGTDLRILVHQVPKG